MTDDRPTGDGPEGAAGTASDSRPQASAGIRRIVVDGAVPLVAFWVFRHAGGTVAGIVAATISAAGLLLLRRRAGYRGAAAAFSGLLITINAAVGLLTDSDAVYLAQGVATTALVGLVFAVTATTSRPLAGLLAADLYTLPAEVWRDGDFVRTFRTISFVWAGFELLTAGLRAAALPSTDLYVAVSLVFGIPATVLLFWWSVRFANKRL